jgi:hypothetical protein
MLTLLLIGLVGSHAGEHPTDCGQQRDAIVVAALLARIDFLEHALPEGRKASCVVVGIGGEKGHKPPSRWAMFSLAKHLRAGVRPITEQSACRDGIVAVVGPPVCFREDAAGFSVPGEHCDWIAERSRGKWVASPPLVCE